ncbi:RNA polymerase sigma factor [Actinoallomurus rhizosphaericola]|uniref:RNA polymerase sigma factor n=1 Tax=Actinoallomurus rhizosphaericola TaxID=2952536 RepID=UPI0020902FC2|nr:sigma-70 family RNA polymerase sigma factor [Actinoallomurus rhizosphaericola]MCO5991956.1 sigma-70 family RNA polymerase sigma factor [Actinoallomurus rhizosphaericola]
MEPLDERRRRFAEIYAACHDPVLGYVMRRAENGHDAADVLAETFLIAWRRLDDVPAGDGARPWLYGVARRVLANHRRGERRRSALGDRLRAELGPVIRPAEDRDGSGAVAEAFRGLSEDDRELLSLVGWEGLDAGEIATVLGCSRNAVRIRLHRARKRFARALADQEARESRAETHHHRARVAKGEHA